MPVSDSLGIAQFLHDNVSSNLAVMKMQLSHMYSETKNRKQRRELKSMSELVDELIASIRQASSGVREAVAPGSSLCSAVHDCATDFQQRTSIRTSFTWMGSDDGISDKISAAVLAIVHEALANVVRHAHATEVHIDAAARTGFLTLSVRDNGSGISRCSVRRRNGFGLFSIRERTNDCSGTVRFRSNSGRGFEIVVRIPLFDKSTVFSNRTASLHS